MHTKVLAARFDRDKAERVRDKFIEIQVPIDALDRAHSRQTRHRVVSVGLWQRRTWKRTWKRTWRDRWPVSCFDRFALT